MSQHMNLFVVLSIPSAMKYNFAQVARESGFQLRSYKDGHLDWRLVGSVEIERLLREQNLEQIDSVLAHLAEVPLGTLLETNILDTGIAKYFLLSQFAIQYLLFCRKFLDETVDDLKEAHGSAQMEIATLKRSLAEANNEILQLHKKVTQMEAIHEVIYPCHLCTKNFVSNDALNLHISRKHSSDNIKHEVGRVETPATTGKERENDLNLINAIKLELEVKHLKERLNNAERKIKESCDISAARTHECPCQESPRNRVHSIGIQSNLYENKENDDIVNDKMCSRYESTEQLSVLQENLEELNQWKKEQQKENVAFLADIENKLKDLKQALEATQKQQKSQVETKENAAPTSLKDLEEFLNVKVEDIAKSSSAKMNEIVSKMEVNYNRKLEKLEKHLETLAARPKNEEIRTNKIKEVVEAVPVQENPSSTINASEEEIEPLKTTQPAINKNIIVVTNTKEKDTHVYEEGQQESSEQSSSPSNNTYIKSNGPKKDDDSEDSTDISDEIEEEEDKAEVKTRYKKIENRGNKATSTKQAPPRTIPKTVTRKAVIKMVDARITSLGIDRKCKSLTQTTKSHITDELNKRRNAIKNKHPNFYATRNKIKKFVDKLCSNKMPENAGKLLKATQQQVADTKTVPKKNRDAEDFSNSDEDSDVLMQPIKVSTPVQNNPNSSLNIDFKQRLENILASPIKKPKDNYDFTSTVQQQRALVMKPIPMPRKRVMFTPENY